MLPNKGIPGFRFAACDAAAAAGDKRQGGADRTVDVKPPQSESMLIFSFDEHILTIKFSNLYYDSINHLSRKTVTTSIFLRQFFRFERISISDI